MAETIETQAPYGATVWKTIPARMEAETVSADVAGVPVRIAVSRDSGGGAVEIALDGPDEHRAMLMALGVAISRAMQGRGDSDDAA